MSLSRKHQEFVNNYFLMNMNGTDAYQATYPKSSRESARRLGSQLLTKVDIQAEITCRLKEKQLPADEVLARLGDMARSDIIEFANVTRLSDLADDKYSGKTHVIKKFKRKIILTKAGQQIEEIELELYPADNALVNIGKQHGLFADKHVVDLKVEKEIDGILDVLEGILDPDSYERALRALGGPEGSPGTAEAEETEAGESE